MDTQSRGSEAVPPEATCWVVFTSLRFWTHFIDYNKMCVVKSLLQGDKIDKDIIHNFTISAGARPRTKKQGACASFTLVFLWSGQALTDWMFSGSIKLLLLSITVWTGTCTSNFCTLPYNCILKLIYSNCTVNIAVRYPTNFSSDYATEQKSSGTINSLNKLHIQRN